MYFSDEVTLLRNSSWVVFATSGSAKLHIYPASQLALSYTRALLQLFVLYLHDESCIHYQLFLFAL